MLDFKLSVTTTKQKVQQWKGANAIFVPSHVNKEATYGNVQEVYV